MKNILVLTVFILTITVVKAQRIIEKNITYKNQFVELDVKFASKIEVKTWDKPTVYFKAEIYTKDDKYQDLYKVDINESNSTISIISKSKKVFKAFQDEWNKENGKKRYYNSFDWYEFNYTLYVPKNTRFTVSSINGDLKSELIEGEFEAELINGDIDIAKYKGDLDLQTINGVIDLKMDNADLVAETVHGDIYADENLKFNSTSRHVGQKINGNSGKATNRLRLNTVNGNIYLRL